VKALRIIGKFLKYALLTFLIIIILGLTATYVFQDKIISLTFNEINKHLATKIEIDPKVNLSIFDKFPEISIEIKNVRIQEAIPGSTDKLATLKNLYFTFDAFDFIQGKYVINKIYAESGDINIKIDKDGNPNYNILKADTTAENNISFNLEKLIIQDVLFNYVNNSINQHHSVYIDEANSSLSLKDRIYNIGLKGDLLIHNIRIEENEYLKNKPISINSSFEYHEDNYLFKIHPSIIKVEGSEFNLAGFYQGDDKKEIDLKFTAQKSTISTLISLLPEKISRELSVYKSSGNVFFETTVKGYITPDDNPQVIVNFGFANASFYHPDFGKKIQNANLKGIYSNGDLRKPKSSFISLTDISAVFHGKKFEGDFNLENFDDPFLKFHINGGIDVASFLEFYPSNKISDASGSIDFNFSFEGKSNDLKTKAGQEKVTAAGNVFLKDLNFILTSHKINCKNINGNFDFDKNNVLIQQLSGLVGKSSFDISGSFKNFFSKMIFDKDQLIVEAKLKSNFIDLNEILAVFGSENTTNTNSNSIDSTNKKSFNLSDYRFKINCDVKRIQYERLTAKNVTGSIDFNQPLAIINDFSFNAAGGKVQFNTFLHFNKLDQIEVNTKAHLSNIYLDSVFYICENFKQDFLTHKNVKGQFTGDIKSFFIIDKNMEINTPSLVATIDASILNGELNNFEPMKKMSRLIDEKQLENIKFSEIKNKIHIEKSVIVIPEMEIKSNISNITVLGTHTFDQHIDYSLTVPLKNFKKKPKTDKDEAFGAIEEVKKGNTLIFVTIKGTTDNYKVAYDKKRTGNKIKNDLAKERKEVEQLFKIKKPAAEIENSSDPAEFEYFDF
jgi:hypothetical protein